MKRRRFKLRRRYGRASPLVPGQKIKLSMRPGPKQPCEFDVVDQGGNIRGVIKYSHRGYCFVAAEGVEDSSWVKTKNIALGRFKQYVRRLA